MKYLLLIPALAIFFAGCISSQAGTKKYSGSTGIIAEAEIKEGFLASNLLQSYEVTGVSRWAFLVFDDITTAIGPLKKGELLSKLDSKPGWTRVWIPRLKVAGWVRQEEISLSNETETNDSYIPLDVLSTVYLDRDGIDILEEPLKNSPLIARVQRKEKWFLLNEKDGWYKLWLPEFRKSGWVLGKEEAEPEPKPQKDEEESMESAPTGQIPGGIFATYRVASESCMVFSEPGSSNTPLGSLKNGDLLKKLNSDSGWMRVWISPSEKTGWVVEKNLELVGKTNEPDQSLVPAEAFPVLEIAKPMVNIREGPSSSSAIIFVGKEKEKYSVLDEKKKWYQIWLPNFQKCGWIYGKLAIKH